MTHKRNVSEYIVGHVMAKTGKTDRPLLVVLSDLHTRSSRPSHFLSHIPHDLSPDSSVLCSSRTCPSHKPLLNIPTALRLPQLYCCSLSSCLCTMSKICCSPSVQRRRDSFMASARIRGSLLISTFARAVLINRKSVLSADRTTAAVEKQRLMPMRMYNATCGKRMMAGSAGVVMLAA